MYFPLLCGFNVEAKAKGWPAEVRPNKLDYNWDGNYVHFIPSSYNIHKHNGACQTERFVD